MVRQICGLNTRSKLSKYTIVVRNNANASQFEECIPAGKGHIMYVAWSGMSAKGITVLKFCTCIKPSWSPKHIFLTTIKLFILNYLSLELTTNTKNVYNFV